MTKQLPVVFLLAGLCLLDGCGGNNVSGANPTLPPAVSMAITSTTPPSGTAGTPYGGTGFFLTASGGMAPYHWRWAADSKSSLPEGMSLSAEGLISGMAKLAGAYNVIVTVFDAESPAVQVSARYTIQIGGAPALAITSGAPPSGIAGVEYGPATTEYFACRWTPVLGWHLVCTQCSTFASCASLPPCRGAITPLQCRLTKNVFLGFTFTAAGGVSPYTWSATGLPPQLNLDSSTGEMTGTPTGAGSYSVTITATDSQSTPVQTSADYLIDIADPPAATP